MYYINQLLPSSNARKATERIRVHFNAFSRKVRCVGRRPSRSPPHYPVQHWPWHVHLHRFATFFLEHLFLAAFFVLAAHGVLDDHDLALAS